MKCPECKTEMINVLNTAEFIADETGNFGFCPNCGTQTKLE